MKMPLLLSIFIIIPFIHSTTLFVVDDTQDLQDYHAFISHLKTNGPIKTIVSNNPNSEQDFIHSLPSSESIYLIGNSLKLLSNSNIVSLLNHLKNKNLFFAAGSNSSPTVNSLSRKLNFHFDQKIETEISASDAKASEVTGRVIEPIPFKGCKLKISKRNKKRFSVVFGTSEFGRETKSITAVTVNHSFKSRVLILGSTDLCRYKDGTKRKKVCENMADWVSHRRGILRVSSLSLKIPNSTEISKGQFANTGDIEVEAAVEEQIKGKWIPFDGPLKAEREFWPITARLSPIKEGRFSGRIPFIEGSKIVHVKIVSSRWYSVEGESLKKIVLVSPGISLQISPAEIVCGIFALVFLCLVMLTN